MGKSDGELNLQDLYLKGDGASAGVKAWAWVLAVVVLLVILMMVYNVLDLAKLKGAIFGTERLRATYNWVGGAAGGSTGFMSETSDPALGGTSHGQGQAVMIGERLVPGYKDWPSPTESVPEQWEFSTSPCDLPAVANSNNGNSTGVGNRSARVNGAVQADPNIKYGANYKGNEHLSAQWKNAQERALSSRGASGSSFDSMRNSMRGRERMKEEADLYDVLHGA